jgi:hypothetical protein
MDTNWKEVFDNTDIACTKKAVTIINDKGILTDEDFAWVTSGAYEAGADCFKSHLIENGYIGGELWISAKYFSDHGTIYAIFDSERFDYDSAKVYLAKIKKQKSSRRV